jgi:signal transduction histidine kinase
MSLGAPLLVLLAIELLVLKRYDLNAPPHLATIFLLARMCLLALVSSHDESGVSLFLYPIIPFITAFSFGPRAGNIMGLLYFAVILWKINGISSTWYAKADVVILFVVATELLIFMQAMATVIHQDEQNRQQTKRLLKDLETSDVQLQEYAEQVADLAAAEERNRLARDIHDSLGHHLTAISIQLEKALAFKDRDDQQSAQAIIDAKLAARAALEDVRQSVATLRTADTHFSLSQALHGLVDSMAERSFAIDYEMTGDETRYSRAALTTLFRAAQEGLTNVQKHADASHVYLRVELDAREARLVLRDDGNGFNPQDTAHWGAPKYNGFGLRGLHERLELVGGQMNLQSNPNQGTELYVTIPKKLLGPVQ